MGSKTGNMIKVGSMSEPMWQSLGSDTLLLVSPLEGYSLELLQPGKASLRMVPAEEAKPGECSKKLGLTDMI